jgi:hypothetical protein
MYTNEETKKGTGNGAHSRIDITDYIARFIRNIREKEGRVFDLRHPAEVAYMKEFLDDPKYTTFKSMRDFTTGFYHWDKQKVDYVSSNLGSSRGFIFYFRCNGCYRRVKYLYEYSTLYSPLCHYCCGLKYRIPSRKERGLSRILRKPYLSSEDRYMLAKRAGITLDDIPKN